MAVAEPRRLRQEPAGSSCQSACSAGLSVPLPARARGREADSEGLRGAAAAGRARVGRRSLDDELLAPPAALQVIIALRNGSAGPQQGLGWGPSGCAWPSTQVSSRASVR